jgi:acyl carrier protein
VKQAVVVILEDHPGNKQIAAYWTPREGQGPCQAGELRRHLQQRLPDYMVPAVLVQLELFPLTPNGKVNRKALPRPERNEQDNENYMAPRTPIEQTLCPIWAEVLHMERVGIHDNFFHLGGHSLLAIQVMARLRDSFSLEFSLRDFFRYPTIAQFAEIVQSALFTKVEEMSEDEAERLLRAHQES